MEPSSLLRVLQPLASTPSAAQGLCVRGNCLGQGCPHTQTRLSFPQVKQQVCLTWSEQVHLVHTQGQGEDSEP